MNIRKFVEKAIQLSPISFRPDIPIEKAAYLSVNYGYPEPSQGGIDLIYSHRGDADNGIDWALEHMQDFTEQVIENIINDCIAVVQQSENLTDEAKQKLTAEIRQRFEIAVH